MEKIKEEIITSMICEDEKDIIDFESDLYIIEGNSDMVWENSIKFVKFPKDTLVYVN